MTFSAEFWLFKSFFVSSYFADTWATFVIFPPLNLTWHILNAEMYFDLLKFVLKVLARLCGAQQMIKLNNVKVNKTVDLKRSVCLSERERSEKGLRL